MSSDSDSCPTTRPPAGGGPTLEEVVERYFREAAEGKPVDQEAYFREYPALAEALRGVFRTLDFVEATGRSLRSDGLERGRTLGDFRILGEIGRGGMGVVYDAVQLSLNRRVALKVLPAFAALSEGAAERFRREAATAARLHHSNIVPVHASGQEDGISYYAMQYIEGRSLAQHLAQMRDGHTRPERDYYRRVTRWGLQAAQALAYAHEHGAIHRDIKPGNFILDGHDDVWLADFGLVHDDANTTITLSGDFVGTARYMSPEQARGGRARLDPRTDIYSLGATLYELLTLQPPFDGESRDAVLHQITFNDPVPLRRLNGAVPRDLETIIGKCLEKDAERRYRSASDLAEDLRRHLDGLPIRARRTSLLVKTMRRLRRHRVGVSVGVVVVTLVVALALVVAQNRRTRAAGKLADALDLLLFEQHPQQAFAALQDAANLGNDSATLHLYRGLVPLLTSQPQRAITDLLEAYQRSPDDPEACYALSAAFYSVGDGTNGRRYFDQVADEPIGTALGWYLRGLALTQIQAPGAIEAFNRTVALRADFTPAIEARAFYRGHRLLTTGSQDDLQPMLNDFDAWVLFQPDSARSYAARGTGWLFAAGHALTQPALRRNREQWLARSREDLERAAKMSAGDDVSILMRLGVYYRVIGDFAAAADYFAKAQQADTAASGDQHVGIANHRALALHALGNIDAASEVVDAARQTPPAFFALDMHHAILLAEPGRMDEAVAACRESMRLQRDNATSLHLTAAMLMLLGCEAEVGGMLAEIDPRGDLPRSDERYAEEGTLTQAFLAGSVTAEELLAAMQATPAQQCHAHFFIAMQLFGRGDRTHAREHLDACLSTGVFIYVDYRFAQTFAARAAADPAWPAWIAK